MRTGEIAAKVVTEALEVGSTDEAFLSQYQVEWKGDFWKELKTNILFRDFLLNRAESIMKTVSKDEKLMEMSVGTGLGWLSSHEYKWKLTRRYLWLLLKSYVEAT